MVDKNVSDKVVWENGITPDNDFTPSMSQSAFQPMSQSQMIFCYKCNNVIPSNSKFCPYCEIELYTICPKCGVKYSSQYPACGQCGTNRLKYIESQIREKEKIEAEKRDERLRQEKLEQEKLEKKRQEQELKEQIINTKEYQSTYSILKESLESLDVKFKLPLLLSPIFLIISVTVFSLLGEESAILILFGFVLAGLCLLWSVILDSRSTDSEKREKYILQYLKKNNCDYNKDMLTYVLNKMRDSSYKYVEDDLSEWCIEAYIKHYNG